MEKAKHLEFIQNIITRMNTNSFQLKALTVTIVSALIVLYASKEQWELLLLAGVIVGVFGLIDNYYLTMERRFRGLYNDVVKGSSNVRPFELNPLPYKKGRFRYINTLKSINTFLYFAFFVLVMVLLILTLF